MTAAETPLLILVDGSSYLFRAYYALPPLSNVEGHPTGAMYGVINMLRKLATDYPAAHIAVVFDSKEKTLRHQLYENYKANRALMPDDLAKQIAPLHEIIRALGFPLIIETGVEADDIIGTLTKQAESKGMHVLISTGDKDMAQLVNERVTLINTMNNQKLDQEGVKIKFGVRPERIIDYLALMGDSVDNIPGIPQVGPKTAVKWIEQYGSLDEVIKAANEIKGKVGESLRNHLNNLPLSRKLVTIHCDIPLNLKIDELKITEKNKAVLMDLFTRFEFKNWLTELTKEINEPEVSLQYEVICDKKTLNAWINRLKKAKFFSFNLEATHVDPLQGELVGISFAVSENEAAYIPLAHCYPAAPEQLDRTTVLLLLKPILENPKQNYIGQNIKFDLELLAQYEIQLKNKLWDTLLEAYVLNSASAHYNLDILALKYLNQTSTSLIDLAGKGAKQIPLNQIDINKVAKFSAEKASLAFELHHFLIKRIKDEPGTQQVFEKIELPLMPVLAQMELRGVLIDSKQLALQSEDLASRISLLEKEAFKIAGKTFNLSSPKQLQSILYDELKIPIFKKTPSGQPSTAEDVLQALSHQHLLPKIILAYRSYSKLKSTYTDKLPEQINVKTGRVHTCYNQAVTATGRLSSINPNLQNIPARTEEGRKIRESFIAPAGYKIISADYSQIELRIIAHLSKDPGLLQAFEQELDIHQTTASEVFGVSFDQVNPEQRRNAKAINFGLLYGMSSFGLSLQLGISRTEAQHYMDIYFSRYPKVHDYLNSVRVAASHQGYVETMHGRRIYTPEINSNNIPRRRAQERAAINAPMQGTAAEIIKLAMIDIDRWIKNNNLDIHMIMQVHDELIFEVRASLVEKAIKNIQNLMQNAVKLSVPLLVDIGVGNHWDEAH